MESRRTVLIWLVAALAIGGAIDVFTFNERGDISIWRLLSAIPVLVLTWAWIRADRHRQNLPMYTQGFTWLLALLLPVAFAFHAFKSRSPLQAVLLIIGAIGIVIVGSLAGAMIAILVGGFIGLNI